MTAEIQPDDTTTLPPGMTTTVGAIEDLLTRAERTPAPTDLVISPVQLHQRNLKLRLTKANQPVDSFVFSEPDAVAADILTAVRSRPSPLDRVDRLALIGDILSEDTPATQQFRLLLGSPPEHAAKEVEQARAEIDATTNFHPDRVEAYREIAASSPAPVAADLRNVLRGTIAIERELRSRTERLATNGAVFRAATRHLRLHGADAWEMAYPSIERISVVGLSSVRAPLVDLLATITAVCDIESNLYFRNATGAYLADRLESILSIDTPGQVVL